jgi:N-methylhydantoinase A
MRQMGYRIAVDVGGTFTDLVCVAPGGEVLVEKTLSTPADQSVGVMDGLERLARRVGCSLEELCSSTEAFVHGSTVADNTMIEMNGARVGLLTTAGHRDEIELRRCFKEEIWDPAYPAPPPIARRRARMAIDERLGADGEVVRELPEEQVREAARRLSLLGVESVAVAFLFSYLNPAHERRAREILLEEMPELAHISLSHEVLPRAPEFERTSTTLVNAYVGPRLSRYVNGLTSKLREAGYTGEVLLMQSTGGVMPADYVTRNAVSLLGSGPTAGVLGAARVASSIKVGDFVSVDMGGTSYDICVVRGGEPTVSLDWNWRHRYYIGLPMVDVRAIGAGGGSIASVQAGSLSVGPQSAGAEPGPACYGRGGTMPTVTDADLVLGYLPAEGFAAGRMTLDRDAAVSAIRREVAEPLGTDVMEAAWAIRQVVDATMADAVRRVLASQGVDPRDLSLVAYGGNGPVHAWSQALGLGIRRVLLPRSAPVFSALGLLVADYRIESVRSYVTRVGGIDPARVRHAFVEMSEQAFKELTPAGVAPEQVRIQCFANMCYPGQNFDLSVPVLGESEFDAGDVAFLVGRFHDLHEADRGFCFPEHEPLLRSLRMVAVAAGACPPELAAVSGVADSGPAHLSTRRAYFGEGMVEAPVYTGSSVRPGMVIEGPAFIDEPFTVVVVPPGAVASLDEAGHFELSHAS